MPTVTIDGRQVRVESGTTVLQAARGAGIDIPTLCHVEGLEPNASCYLCAVQVAGQRNLSPACALPVTDGMVVSTDTDDVRSARRMALELLLSDHAGDCVAPCAARCPASLDIAGFVRGIAGRDSRQAMEVISRHLALPGALGRICPRLCEARCRREDHDEGLAIAALHRYAADRDALAVDPYLPPRAPSTGKSVAIVGAGPAGLAAAYYLLPRGHDCALLDAHDAPGGMLRHAIPAYRLPRDPLEAEIDGIRRLGARFRMGARWGEDFSLAELRERFDAVFLAIGAQRSQSLRCEGEDLALSGIEFLERVAGGDSPDPGREVVVIGGGNTAMDCARSCVRLGATSVRVLYRRTRQEMPCLMEEVVAAEEEGVRVDYLVAPIRLEPAGASSQRLTCQRMELGEPDDSGRRRPVPVAGSEFDLEATTVIAAIGQSVDRDLPEGEGLTVSAWGIAADESTLATNLPGVFAGGDAVLGADLAVRAVAAGRKAAASIHQLLSDLPVVGEPSSVDIAMHPMDDAERAEIFRAIERSARVPTGEIPRRRRLRSFDEVDPGLDDAVALSESRRCLSCGCRKADCCRVRALATEYGADPYRFAGARRRFTRDLTHPEIIYEPGKCILCDACVRIAAAAGEPLGLAPIGRGFDVAVGVPFGEPLSEALRETARRCADACPTGALALRTARACDLLHIDAAPIVQGVG